MKKGRIVCCLCILSLAILAFSGCAEKEPQMQAEIESEENHLPAETFKGDSKPLGDGIVYSWVTLDAEGNPSTIGVNFTKPALSGLSEVEVVEHILPLPEEASATAYDHIGIDWNPEGHEPQEIYDSAHFDIHFYMIGQEERDRITATEEDMKNLEKQPEPEFIPEGYVPTPAGVPRMGAHWIDPSAPEFNEQPFGETFIYGFYNGEMVFVEPMVTIDFLKTKPEFTKQLKLPESYPTDAYYPTGYSVRYNEATEEYTIALEEMTPR